MPSPSDLEPILSRVRTDISAIKTKDGTSIWKRDEPLTPSRIQAHLDGTCLRGVCPIREGEDTTQVALLDLDSHKGETAWNEMTAIADEIITHFDKNQMYAMPFRSTGGKGIHLYFVWAKPVDAYTVRERLKELLAEIGYKNGTNGVAKKEIEIFPKQDSVPVGGCGNQFILPYSPKGEPLLAPDWAESIHLKKREKPAPNPKVYQSYDDKPDIQEVISALQAIPAHDYDMWINIGFSLQDAFGDAGFNIWDSWSSTSSKYNAKEMRGKWKSFHNDRGITIATLFDQARINGWHPVPRERPVVDTSLVDGFVEKMKASTKPVAPTPIDFDPLELTGIIGDTIRWICKTAIKPQPMLAFLNVIAFAGAVFGRRYASILDTRTNVYMVGVADSGDGKDQSRKMLKRLAIASGLEAFLGGDSVRSDTGLVRGLSGNCSQILMLDEFGKLLQGLTDKGASPHHKAVIKVLMSLYSDSSGVYDHGSYANPQVNKQIIIQCPNLCIYGTTTESEYVKGLHRDAILSGELNRVMAIKVGSVPRRRVDKVTVMDNELVAAWKEYCTGASLLSLSLQAPEPIIVPWADQEADDFQWSLALEQDIIGGSDNLTRALWNRRHENIVKIALIVAIARDKDYATIEREDLELGRSIVDASLNYMYSLMSHDMAETPYEADYLKAYKIIKSAKNKTISRTELSLKMQGKKKKEIDDIVLSLEDQGKITIERVQGKTKSIILYKAA